MRLFFAFADLGRTKRQVVKMLWDRGEPIDILVSYYFIRTKNRMLDRVRMIRRYVSGLMIDSGAYQVLADDLKPSHMTQMIDDYARVSKYLLSNGVVDFVVIPDVPGDPESTIRNAETFLSLIGDELRVISVLQGIELRDFMESYQFFKDRGLITPVIGVGNVNAFRNNISGLLSLLRWLRRVHNGKIHLFGISRTLHKAGVSYYIDSADTSSFIQTLKRRMSRGEKYGIELLIEIIREEREFFSTRASSLLENM